MWRKAKIWLRRQHWLSGYHRAAYFFTNFCLALIALNGLLGLFLSATERDRRDPRLGANVDLRAYRDVPKDRLRETLNDYHEYLLLGSVFRPYVQIGEPPFRSASVNVHRDRYGFEYRRTSETEGNTDGKVKVFVFGGSTTFGVNVADEWTIPSYLAHALGDATVYNFGVRSHSWFQEQLLFQRLIHAGNIPQIAVFIDGATIGSNGWSRNYPAWTWRAARIWEEAQNGIRHVTLPEFIPLFRVINILSHNKIEKKMSWLMEKRYQHLKYEPDPEKEPALIKQSYLSSLKQRAALAKAFGVTPLFVWQPNRAYECGPPPALSEEYLDIVPRVYESMRTVRERHFVNLSRLCKGGDEVVRFIDDIHYGPSFHREIAEAIAKEIRKSAPAVRTIASKIPS